MNGEPGGPPRGRFAGVSRVIRFNWPYYIIALLVVFSGAVLVTRVDMGAVLLSFVVGMLCIPVLFIVTSLVASFYIYDVSDLHQWEWLAQTLPAMPKSWISFHAGYDETEGALASVFDGENGRTYDIYDEQVFDEASLQRARKFNAMPVVEPVKLDALPVENDSTEATFLILTAHEIRIRSQRDRFFAELYRISQPRGRVILVEHLRNVRNFVAFAHGAFHFYSRGEWIDVSSRAGFEVLAEFRKTPFIRVFVLEKPTDVQSN
jgi:hypothetical protein